MQDAQIIVDSEASENVVKDMAYFSGIETVPPMTILLANESTDRTTCRGVIRIDVEVKQLLKCKTYYNPTLKMNMHSCSRQDEFDITTKFEKNGCFLYDRKQGGKPVGSMEMNPNDVLYAGRLIVPARRIRLNYTVDRGNV